MKHFLCLQCGHFIWTASVRPRRLPSRRSLTLNWIITGDDLAKNCCQTFYIELSFLVKVGGFLMFPAEWVLNRDESALREHPTASLPVTLLVGAALGSREVNSQPRCARLKSTNQKAPRRRHGGNPPDGGRPFDLISLRLPACDGQGAGMCVCARLHQQL